MLKTALVILAAVVAIAIVVAFRLDAPRFILGILTYGRQAREGTLRVGDPAPAVSVHELDGGEPRPLADWIGDRPLVLVFGSFT